MKIWDKFKEKIIKAQMGLSLVKVALDLKKAQHKNTLFAPIPQEKGKWGDLTLQHFGALIPLAVLMLAGIWWRPMIWIALAGYLAYNVATYRKLDSR